MRVTSVRAGGLHGGSADACGGMLSRQRKVPGSQNPGAQCRGMPPLSPVVGAGEATPAVCAGFSHLSLSQARVSP